MMRLGAFQYAYRKWLQETARKLEMIAGKAAKAVGT